MVVGDVGAVVERCDGRELGPVEGVFVSIMVVFGVGTMEVGRVGEGVVLRIWRREGWLFGRCDGEEDCERE